MREQKKKALVSRAVEPVRGFLIDLIDRLIH